MEHDRPPYKEMVDTKNNTSVLGTFTPELIRAARYSLIRAEAFGNERKRLAIEAYLGTTTGLNGDGRRDLRDSVRPAERPTMSLTTSAPPRTSDGVPSL